MNWRLGLVAVGCLWASAPPAWMPGGGLLVLVGWMAFYAAIAEGVVRRPWRQAYVVGTLHMLAFSFSVRHVMFEAYMAIGLLGGLYYVLMVAWTRAASRWVPGALAFGLALAGAHWLRGHLTEIQYPHGQPVHALYRFPELLGSLTWGSEIFANLLLGVVAAGIVDFYRAWRVGTPGYRRSALVLGAAGLVFVVTIWPPGSVPAADQEVRIAALEPGFTALECLQGADRALGGERVLRPSRRLVAATPDLDLLLWPESVNVHALIGMTEPPQLSWVPGVELGLSGSTRLLAGTGWYWGDPEARELKVVAVLTDARRRYLGHQEKRRLVPGGEHQPFLDWLPASWSAWLLGMFERAMDQRLPNVTPGEVRPLLQTAGGVGFGAMICFDNAFPEISEDSVAAGASFLVVLSNESWYRGGAELEQMVAMTVCRALECRVPILRCTVDGRSLVVGADGRLGASLPPQEARSSRFLQLELAVSETGHRAVPPLHPLVRWLVLGSLLALIGPLYRSRGRIFRRARLADPEHHS